MGDNEEINWREFATHIAEESVDRVIDYCEQHPRPIRCAKQFLNLGILDLARKAAYDLHDINISYDDIFLLKEMPPDVFKEASEYADKLIMEYIAWTMDRFKEWCSDSCDRWCYPRDDYNDCFKECYDRCYREETS